MILLKNNAGISLFGKAGGSEGGRKKEGRRRVFLSIFSMMDDAIYVLK